MMFFFIVLLIFFFLFNWRGKKNRLRKYRMSTHSHVCGMWMWINMSGFTFTINLKAYKLYNRGKIRFKTTNTRTNSSRRPSSNKTIQDIYSEKISLQMSVFACVRACVSECASLFHMGYTQFNI